MARQTNNRTISTGAQKAAHSSCPYNPLIANAFFRTGQIEAWGRGIQRIFTACRDVGNPKPKIRYEPNDLWFEFPFSPAYLAIFPQQTNVPDKKEWGEKWGENWGENWSTAITAKRLIIAKAMLQNPSISTPQMASKVGMGTTGVERHLKIMRDIGCIRRIGPAKGGRWEVLP